MELRVAMVAILFGAGVTSSAWAAPAAKADKTANMDKGAKADMAAKGVHPAKMTCQEFMELDDVAKPKVVYWAEGFNGKGKPDDAVVDVESTDRLVPMVMEVCKSAPNESFLKKTKEQSKMQAKEASKKAH